MSASILRYFGSKYRLYSWLKDYLPPHQTYCEPFGGGAGVLLQKPPSKVEVYNDLSNRVTNFFTVLRDRPRELQRVLIHSPYNFADWQASFEDKGTDLERARRLFVYCWQSFKPRLNTRGEWRVGYATTNSSPLTDYRRAIKAITQASQRFQNVYIFNHNYADVMTKFDSPDTLHYLDPPYLSETRHHKNEYIFELSSQAHYDLARFVTGLKGMVIVSGYSSDLYNEAFSGYQLVTKQVQTNNINAFKTECLWLSPNIKLQRTLW